MLARYLCIGCGFARRATVGLRLGSQGSPRGVGVFVWARCPSRDMGEFFRVK